MPVAAGARQLKEHDTRLWRMLKAHVAAAHPQADWSNVCCVGCDERSVRQGHRSVSVFCDRIGKRVLCAVPGKDQSTWEEFARALEAHHGHPRAITEVSIEMSPSSIAGGKENMGSQAALVFDQFHVLAHVIEAVDAVRRAERRFGGWDDRPALKETRWVWRKNPVHHTPAEARKRQRLETLNLLTAKAYQRRLTLQDIYSLDSVAVAKRKLRAWCRWVRRTADKHNSLLFVAMRNCADRSESHLAGIPRALDPSHNQRLHGGADERLLRQQTQSARLSLHHQSHHHALFRGRQAPPPRPLILARSLSR
jgi:transposase